MQVCDQADANFPVKHSGVNVVALYETGDTWPTCHMHVTRR